MNSSLLYQKLIYALSTTLPLSWSGFFVTVYAMYKDRCIDACQQIFPPILSWLVPYMEIIIPVIAIVAPWIVYMTLRWIPATTQIPRKKQSKVNLDIKLSTMDIMDRDGLLCLSYNQNNFVGGTHIQGKPNLFAQFMSRYFSVAGQNPASLVFDWDLFVLQYKSPETFVMYVDHDGKLCECDKEAVPPKSVVAAHHDSRPDSTPADGKGPLFPEGTVIFLKLPSNADHREYAVLLCNCYYVWPSAKSHFKSDYSGKCLTSLWAVLTKSKYQTRFSGSNVCLPLIGTGKISDRLGAYGAMWSIIQTARESANENGTPHFCLNICIPVREMRARGLYIRDVIEYLSNAAVG